MLIAELDELVSAAGNVVVCVYSPCAGPGLPAASWNVTGYDDELAALIVDIDNDPWNSADLSERFARADIDPNRVLSIRIAEWDVDSDGQYIGAIRDAYVDGDGPSEYGADDAYSAIVIELVD